MRENPQENQKQRYWRKVSFFLGILLIAWFGYSLANDIFNGKFVAGDNLELAGSISVLDTDLENSDSDLDGQNSSESVVTEEEIESTAQIIATESEAPPINAQQTIEVQEQDLVADVDKESKVMQDDSQELQGTEQIVQGTEINEFDSEDTMYACGYDTDEIPSHQGVIINEVAWMGGASFYGLTANDEWIELKNITGTPIDVSQWQLIDKDEQINFVFENNTVISAYSLFLLERTDDSSVPGISAGSIYKGALSNADEGLRLFDEGCHLIDQVIANLEWPAGDNDQKRSMERSATLSWYTYNGGARQSIFGTPKSMNSTKPEEDETSHPSNVSSPQATDTVIDTEIHPTIFISEIRAGTENDASDEFIELYNPTHHEVNLMGWALKKKSSGGIAYNLVSASNFLGNIPPYGFFLVVHKNYVGEIKPDLYYSNNSNALAYKNNAVVLYNTDGSVADEISWSEIPEDQSLARSTLEKDSVWVIEEYPDPQNSRSSGN